MPVNEPAAHGASLGFAIAGVLAVNRCGGGWGNSIQWYPYAYHGCRSFRCSDGLQRATDADS